MADTIRPKPDDLRPLPTIRMREWSEEAKAHAREVGVEHLSVELKMETATRRYWLCTEGASEKRDGVPESWVIGFVTPERKDEKGLWAFAEPYNAETVNWFQGIDYLNTLGDDMERLKRQWDKEPTHEVDKAIAEKMKEIDRCMRAMGYQGPLLAKG